MLLHTCQVITPDNNIATVFNISNDIAVTHIFKDYKLPLWVFKHNTKSIIIRAYNVLDSIRYLVGLGEYEKVEIKY